jgi:nucleotide-binding universal stress UspA family protein
LPATHINQLLLALSLLCETINRILLTVDGSKTSFNAGEAAINLAERYIANLVIYVVPPNMRYGYTGGGVFPGFSASLKDGMRVPMERGQTYVDNVKNLAVRMKINVETDLLVGSNSVAKEIVEYAQKEKCDLIVIGTTGTSGIKKMLLGSIASSVVTYSDCPVLVVR